MKKLVVVLSVIVVLLSATLIFVLTKPSGQENSGSSSSLQQSSQNQSSQEQPGDENGYVPTDSLLSFSNENADKIVTEATFDVTQYTGDAGTKIRPLQIFSNGMCLQRDAINRIWGDATNAEHVAIEINGEVYYGSVTEGKFEVYLPMMHAGGPYDMAIITEAGRKVLTNVYIGEVFLLSGQSNMEWMVEGSGALLSDLYLSADCINDKIRMFQVGWNTPNEPSPIAINGSQWKRAEQSTIRNFTAIGYIFGKQMQKELDCPVGLIANPVGGSTIEFWLSQENYQKVQEKYTPYTTSEVIFTPTLGYNGMLYPLAGINLRSVLWYQGESNAFGTQEYYDIALEIFMAQCREMFNNEQLGFTICQLARFNERPYAYSVVNERINAVASKDPYVAVARNLDQGDWFDIHPQDKREIGRRTAYETLRVFFKKDKPAPVNLSGYTFNQDGSVTLELSRTASLVNKTNGFEVYLGNKWSYNCNASIDGNKITLTASEPITKVRYGYTCAMNDENKQDVSKMVTVFDENGFPLDLFEISDPSLDSNLPTSPTLSAGYCDAGYEIVVGGDGSFIVNKSASAGQWTGAMLAVADYSSVYSAFTIKFTTDNVTNLNIQLIVGGGDPTWPKYITVHQSIVQDGEHELLIDFSEILVVDANWNAIPNCYIKDYNIEAIMITLDTAVDASALINEDASCIVHDVTFNAKQ